MLGTFLVLLFAHFYTPFPDVHLAIRDTAGNLYINSNGSFPLVRGDGWDLNEEEAIGRHLFKHFALVKVYSINLLHKLRGNTYAEIQMAPSFGERFQTSVCNLTEDRSVGEDVQVWYQGYGYPYYCAS